MSEDNPIVLSFHDILLRQNDVDLLDRYKWLNDQIIEFHFEYQTKILCKGKESIVNFVGPGTTQLVKLVHSEDLPSIIPTLGRESVKYMFFPVNNSDETASPGGTHWSLLLYCSDNKQFSHYDSMPSMGNDIHARAIARKINSVLNNSSTLNFKEESCPKQKNSYDCGMHVLCTVDHLVQKLAFDKNPTWFTAWDVEQSRYVLKTLILSLKAAEC